MKSVSATAINTSASKLKAPTRYVLVQLASAASSIINRLRSLSRTRVPCCAVLCALRWPAEWWAMRDVPEVGAFAIKFDWSKLTVQNIMKK